jgi:hypothetical protein
MTTLNFLPTHTQRNLNSFGKYFLSIVICFVITACGSSNEDAKTEDLPTENITTEDLPKESITTEDLPTEDITTEDLPTENITTEESQERASFTGRVVKGVISNAIINVYPIININNTYVVDKSALPISTKTNGNGYYQVRPSNKKNDNYYYLEVVTDENSRMLCDIDTGCESSNGSTANFGELFSLATGFTLSNVVKSKAGKINHAPISPLTHLAINKAKSLPGGMSPENVLVANQFIENIFKLGDGALGLTPTDLTSLSDIRKLKSAELKLGLISASFMPYIEQSEWDNLLTLPISEIILSANKLAKYLNTSSLSTQSSITLSSIETETYTHYSNLTATPLSISKHPSSIFVAEGDNASLFVVASSSEPISYQWLKGSIEIANETSASLSLSNISQNSEGIYSVIVSSSNESIESLSALVSVVPAPQPVSILTHPTSLVITEGDSISLSVIAEGDGPLSFQWQKGGSILVDKTSSSLILQAATLSDAGTYSVSVSNTINTIQSDFAVISVLNAANPITILEQPTNAFIIEGSSVSFAVTASGGGFISYQWRKNSQIIADAYNSTYTINTSTAEDSGNYDVVLTNSVGSQVSQKAELLVISKIEPVTIISQPESININEGETASLLVNATGGGALSYEWFKGGVSISNSNSAQLLIDNTILSDQGSYQVFVSNEESSAQSEAVYLSITPVPITILPSTLNLSWDIPTTRADDSELNLSAIQGYLIVYGTDGLNFDQSINIVGGQTVSTLIDLLPNTYYFRIATVEVTGIQSVFSETIQVTIE